VRQHVLRNRPQSAKRMALSWNDVDDAAQDSRHDALLLAAVKAQLDAGGQVKLGVRDVGRIQELEQENMRMSFQLKQLKNVMAVSQGAADAYLVCVCGDWVFVCLCVCGCVSVCHCRRFCPWVSTCVLRVRYAVCVCAQMCRSKKWSR